jgi:hypothetical protein
VRVPIDVRIIVAHDELELISLAEHEQDRQQEKAANGQNLEGFPQRRLLIQPIAAPAIVWILSHLAARG